jgi:radical SAM-linked protein
MARQPDGPPPPPTVQKLRIRYAKRGRLRFASHRDLARTLERALRRASVPMAFSAGFSPHPKISYLGAAPTGAASEAEYLEIGLSVRCDPGAVGAALDAALPEEVAVLDCVEAGEGTGSLADRIDASVWRVELPGVTLAELAPAVD